MHGVDWGKRRRLALTGQTLTYQYSFFTDPTISTLTSGTPSQAVDLSTLSFPRCVGVRFHSEYLVRYHLIGMQVQWQSFADKDFKQSLGKDFYHEDTISREGWAKYYFKGKYQRDVAYILLRIVNPQTGQYIHTYRFQFRKSYQTSLDARYYITDPILGDKIVKNGVIVEMLPRTRPDKSVTYVRGKTTFQQQKIQDVFTSSRQEAVQTNAIIQTSVRYSEKPKMIFLVTPPHLMKYAKLILILVKQLVDLNFDKSYSARRFALKRCNSHWAELIIRWAE